MENVFYRLWDEETFEIGKKIAVRVILKEDPFRNIRDNNQAFLNKLKDRKLDGYEDVWSWLGNLLDDYVIRNHGTKLHVWNAKDTDYEYYYKWLYNTRCICDNDSTVIQFCNEFESLIEEISSGEISLDRDEEFKEFRDKLGFALGKDDTESLYRALPSMKPKQVKPYYNEHKRIQEYFSKTEFADICRHYGHHENQEGWGDRNLRG